MTSVDPRKNESITNQANYLMTVVTSLLIASLTASIQTGVWIPIQYFILGSFWALAAGYREIKKVIDAWTKKQQSSSS